MPIRFRQMTLRTSELLSGTRYSPGLPRPSPVVDTPPNTPSAPMAPRYYVQYIKYTDKTNCAICFVNYQLRRHEGTGLDDHAHGVMHSICQLIMVGVIFRLRQTEICAQNWLFSVCLRRRYIHVNRYFPSGSDGATYRMWFRLPVPNQNPKP